MNTYPKPPKTNNKALKQFQNVCRVNVNEHQHIFENVGVVHSQTKHTTKLCETIGPSNPQKTSNTVWTFG